jgi:lysophospholipase L1-like esterase
MLASMWIRRFTFRHLAALAVVAWACSSSCAPVRLVPGAPDAGSDVATDAGADGAAEGGSDAAVPPDDPTFASVWSGTSLAVPAQQLMVTTAPFVYTYRTYVKPRASGSYQWRFWISNATDSTYGAVPPRPNQPGGTWRIEAATVADGGPSPAGAVGAGTQATVTFSGGTSRSVKPGERFWSDPVVLDLPADHYLAFTWAVSATAAGPVMTFASSPFASSYWAAGANLASQESATGFAATYDQLVAPQMFAYDRAITNRLCFLGDSITQGIGSTRNSYGFWVAKIADGLGPDVGVWNLGSGWARAADAASDGYWLYKAKQCTEVAVILGVNDINSDNVSAEKLLGDLATIIDRIKGHNASTKLILFTVPTFNFTGASYATWAQVNATIRTTPPAGVDRVFDIAAVLSQPAPNDGLLKPGYTTNGDAHPNDLGSTAIANAFLAWY